MTLKLLNQYRDILNEIPDLKSRIKQKRKEVNGHVMVMASLDVPPYTTHSVYVDNLDSLEDMRTTLAIMQRRLRRITRQRKKIEEYINAIPDSLLRQIFQYMIYDGLSWEDVTIKIGGGNSKKALQNKLYRYLKFDGQRGIKA